MFRSAITAHSGLALRGLALRWVYGAAQAALALLFVLGWAACEPSSATVEVQFATANGAKTPPIQVELARTAGEQKRGLMYRRELGTDRGMLFLFGEETPRSFWMKNTYVELDIIFLSSAWKIVSITHRAVPLSETSRPSIHPARYVLEVNGGLAKNWGLTEGDTLEIHGTLR